MTNKKYNKPNPNKSPTKGVATPKEWAKKLKDAKERKK